MKSQSFIRAFLSFVLVIAIGFMEYSIIDDAVTAGHGPFKSAFKKDIKSHELIIARNMQMDDDDEDAAVKYIPHEFYHCDLLQFDQLFIQENSYSNTTSVSDVLPISGRSICDLISVHRI